MLHTNWLFLWVQNFYILSSFILKAFWSPACYTGPERPVYQAVTHTEEILTSWCIDTIDSPDDEHWVARNM